MFSFFKRSKQDSLMKTLKASKTLRVVGRVGLEIDPAVVYESEAYKQAQRNAHLIVNPEMTRQTQPASDLVCDVCRDRIQLQQDGQQYGTLQGCWQSSSSCEEIRYKFHLCELCFSAILLVLRRERDSAG
jgi:uncharacterized protein (DUF3084 family)